MYHTIPCQDKRVSGVGLKGNGCLDFMLFLWNYGKIREPSRQAVPGSRFQKPRYIKMETVVAQWLRCCATNRKVAGSIPAGVTGIFH